MAVLPKFDNRKRNDTILLKNFLKEFHEIMIDSFGFSVVKDEVDPNGMGDIDRSDSGPDTVEIKVDLMRLLWKFSFISSGADIDFSEDMFITFGLKLSKEVF